MNLQYDKTYQVSEEDKHHMAEQFSFNSQRGGANSGVLMGNGEISLHLDRPCHGSLEDVSEDNYGEDRVAVAIYSETSSYATTREGSVPYYTWLIEESPWRYAFVSTTAEEAVRKGVWVRTDLPSNYVVGALIASRYGWNQTDKVDMMNMFTESGVSPTIAFIAAHLLLRVDSLGITDDDCKFKVAPYGYEEWCINPNHIDIAFMLNFQAVDIKNANADFAEDSYYQGVFGLWSGSGDSDEMETEHPGYMDSVLDEITPVVDSQYMFHKWSDDRGKEFRPACSKESVINFAKQLDKEFG